MCVTLRSDIGELRSLQRTNNLAGVSGATGLNKGSTFLNCVGAAVPQPDWTLFTSDPASIPAQCVSGNGVLADLTPAATLIDPSYDVPRSWRASLDWNTSTHGILYRVGTLVSYDLSQ